LTAVLEMLPGLRFVELSSLEAVRDEQTRELTWRREDVYAQRAARRAAPRLAVASFEVGKSWSERKSHVVRFAQKEVSGWKRIDFQQDFDEGWMRPFTSYSPPVDRGIQVDVDIMVRT
jgi:hypothetical protein